MNHRLDNDYFNSMGYWWVTYSRQQLEVEILTTHEYLGFGWTKPIIEKSSNLQIRSKG